MFWGKCFIFAWAMPPKRLQLQIATVCLFLCRAAIKRKKIYLVHLSLEGKQYQHPKKSHFVKNNGNLGRGQLQVIITMVLFFIKARTIHNQKGIKIASAEIDFFYYIEIFYEFWRKLASYFSEILNVFLQNKNQLTFLMQLFHIKLE